VQFWEVVKPFDEVKIFEKNTQEYESAPEETKVAVAAQETQPVSSGLLVLEEECAKAAEEDEQSLARPRFPLVVKVNRSQEKEPEPAEVTQPAQTQS